MDPYRNEYFGFTRNKAYSAKVWRIKEDRIYFKLVSSQGVEFTPVYYANDGHMNLAEIFNKDEEIRIIIKAFRKNNWIEVEPEFLPPDVFAFEHPKGSIVEGVIRLIKGSIMRIELAANVFCDTKRCNHAQLGQTISCEISNYCSSRKRLKVFVFST